MPEESPTAAPSAERGSRYSTWQKHFWELVRFSWVGAFTLSIYLILMWLLDRYCELSTWLDATIAYAPALVLNYLLHRSFTFRSDKRHLEAGPKYLVIQLGGMAINSLVVWLGVDVLLLPFAVAQVLAIGTLSVWSYLGQKLWVFFSRAQMDR